MSRRFLLLLAVLIVATASFADETAFLRTYCIKCHSKTKQAGEREFESLDLTASDFDTQLVLQDIIDQLTLQTMPPDEAKQPSKAERLAAINSLTSTLQKLRRQSSPASRSTVLRRLSRREYLNTVGDLFDMNMTMFDPTVEFPLEATVDGFDNQGDALVTSGFLLEKYLEAADAIVEKAFADSEKPETKTWVFKGDFRQQPELDPAHKEAFNFRYLCLYDSPLAERPEGAYGPLTHRQISTGVHADGEYEIKVLAQALHRDSPYDENTVRISRDEPFRLGIVPGDPTLHEDHVVQPLQPKLAEAEIEDNELKWYEFRVPLDRGFTPRFTFENGMRDARNTYARVFRKYRETLPQQVRKKNGIFEWRKAVIRYGELPHIRIHEVQIRGPIDTQWPTKTRQVVLGDTPFSAEAAEQRITAFASRAYRRPPREDELKRLNQIYHQQIELGNEPFVAFKQTLKAVLCSPSFLYFQPLVEKPGDNVSPHALATRVSYFLTASMPDRQLRQVADSGEILKADVLRSEVKRLLKSPKSQGFVAGFLDSWLHLRALGSMPPDRGEFWEYYTRGLEADMKRESQLFTQDLVDRNASVLEFLRADYSFVNRDLARLYNVKEEVSPEGAARFRKVKFSDARRGGLLGQASVLTVTANGIETSPVTRGVWMLENILGSPTPPPPDDVPAIDPDVRGAKTIRDLLEKHRSSATCNQCHRKIDPLGFAMECFDPVGAMRTRYANRSAIDSAGKLPGGESFKDLAELKELLLKRSDFFARTFTEKLLSYGMGRRMQPADRPAIDEILAKVKSDEYPLRSLIEEVVVSDLFQSP